MRHYTVETEEECVYTYWYDVLAESEEDAKERFLNGEGEEIDCEYMHCNYRDVVSIEPEEYVDEDPESGGDIGDLEDALG